MSDAQQQLDAILAGAHVDAEPFAATSRYAGVPVATWVAPDGRAVPYVTRRVVPPPESFATVAIHTVEQDDRPDTIAAAHLGDPEAYWRVCDANGVVDPNDLTATAGRRVRIGIPSGLPGGGDD